MEEIQQAAELAQAHEIISKMPGGYAAMLDEREAIFLEGKSRKQSCACISQRAPIIVMDEATSALDVETERCDGKYWFVLPRQHCIDDCASFVNNSNADNIVVLNQGLISEQGTHAELLKTWSLLLAHRNTAGSRMTNI